MRDGNNNPARNPPNYRDLDRPAPRLPGFQHLQIHKEKVVETEAKVSCKGPLVALRLGH